MFITSYFHEKTVLVESSNSIFNVDIIIDDYDEAF